ncbi:hypothetical protein DCO49_00430 [Stenotrophomonas sp. SPM]|nr:hypothetical protein DCO49_00430 [Stenotrophomonas sp. SPM]
MRLPAYGSAEPKRLGAACMGGTAMRRLSNGWEQLRNAKGEWLRCRYQRSGCRGRAPTVNALPARTGLRPRLCSYCHGWLGVRTSHHSGQP